MAEFGSQEELAQFLKALHVDYEQYAQKLWNDGLVNSVHMLANADKNDLCQLGVHPIHANDIKARAAPPATAQQPELLQLVVDMKADVAGLQQKMLEFFSDNSSKTIDANDVTDNNVQDIDYAMKIRRESEGPSDLVPDKLRYTWKPNLREDAELQKSEVLNFLDQHLLKELPAPLAGAFCVRDINQSAPTEFPKASFSSLHMNFRGRADYLLVPANKRDVKEAFTLRHYGLIGFEFKKALEEKHMAQARLGHLIYGLCSNTAFLYVLSDLVTGGIVFWAQRLDGPDHLLRVTERRISGMRSLLSFLQKALASAVNAQWGEVYHLPQPDRDYFTIEGCQQPQLAPARVPVLCWDIDDEQDLRGFEEHFGSSKRLCTTCEPPPSGMYV